MAEAKNKTLRSLENAQNSEFDRAQALKSAYNPRAVLLFSLPKPSWI